MNSNAGLLMSVLGSFIGDSTPQRNPNHKGIDSLDPQTGTWVPGQEPYVQPGFGTKLFHPEVAAQEGANNSAMYNAWLANAAKNKINAGNVSVARTGYGKPVEQMSDDELNLLAGGEPSNIPSVNVNSQRQIADVPHLGAINEAEGLKESTRRAVASQKIGLPESTAALSNARIGSELTTIPSTTDRTLAENKFGTEFSNQSLPMIAPRLSLEREEMGSRLRTLPSETERKIAGNTMETQLAQREIENKNLLDSIRSTGLGTQLSLDKTREQMLPYTTQALKNQSIQEAWNSRFLPPAPYLGATIDNGTINPNVRRPDYISPLASIQGLTESANGIGGVKMPDGKPLPMAPKARFDVLTGKAVETPPSVTPVKETEKKSESKASDLDYDTFMNKLNASKTKGSPRVSLKYIANHLADKYKTATIPSNSSIFARDVPYPQPNVYWDAMTGDSKILNHNGIIELMKQLPPEILQQALEEGGIK